MIREQATGGTIKRCLGFCKEWISYIKLLISVAIANLFFYHFLVLLESQSPGTAKLLESLSGAKLFMTLTNWLLEIWKCVFFKPYEGYINTLNLKTMIACRSLDHSDPSICISFQSETFLKTKIKPHSSHYAKGHNEMSSPGNFHHRNLNKLSMILFS